MHLFQIEKKYSKIIVNGFKLKLSLLLQPGHSLKSKREAPPCGVSFPRGSTVYCYFHKI